MRKFGRTRQCRLHRLARAGDEAATGTLRLVDAQQLLEEPYVADRHLVGVHAERLRHHGGATAACHDHPVPIGIQRQKMVVPTLVADRLGKVAPSSEIRRILACASGFRRRASRERVPRSFRSCRPARSRSHTRTPARPPRTDASSRGARPSHLVELRVGTHVHQTGHAVGEAEERRSGSDVPGVVIAQADCFELGELLVARDETQLVDARREAQDRAQARREIRGAPVRRDLIGDDRILAEDSERGTMRGDAVNSRSRPRSRRRLPRVRRASPLGPFMSRS